MPLETFHKLPPDRKARIISAGIYAFSRNSYKDVIMDSITRSCQISKGILFHYFGSKKEFYLFCLKTAMDRLTEETEPEDAHGFYEILFSFMNRKIAKCLQYPDEMHLVNMASRDASAEITMEKNAILQSYRTVIQAESMQTLKKAMSALAIPKENSNPLTAEGLYLYIQAVVNKYLLQYQLTPDIFFQNSGQTKAEMKQYLELMLYGICEKEDL